MAELKQSCIEKKNTFQPVIVIVGTLERILSSYVVINEVIYAVADFLRAVDIAFKVFHSLNCSYPAACQPVWTFLQKYFYDLNTTYDKNYSTVNKLIENLNF